MATYKLHLKSAGSDKLSVVKAVKEITGLGIKAYIDLVNSAPCVIKEGYTDRSTAEADRKKLTALGADAYVETIGSETESGYTINAIVVDKSNKVPVSEEAVESPEIYLNVKPFHGQYQNEVQYGNDKGNGMYTFNYMSAFALEEIEIYIASADFETTEVRHSTFEQQTVSPPSYKTLPDPLIIELVPLSPPDTSAYTFSITLRNGMDTSISIADATISLRAATNELIVTGKTNANGVFSYVTQNDYSDFKGAPYYMTIEKKHFNTTSTKISWGTGKTINGNTKYNNTNTGATLDPKGVIYFKPQYYDKSDFTYKDFTGTLFLQLFNARTGKNLTSSTTISSAITQDTDGYYYPAVTNDGLYNITLYLINTGSVYFWLTSTDPSVVQGGDSTPYIFFYPYNLFNSTGATDYTIQKYLTFYPKQKRLTISDLKRCYVSEYVHHFPTTNINVEYDKTFCPRCLTIKGNYYQNTLGYDTQLPSTDQLAPYNVSSFRIVLCVYENETYMYNGDAPTQYGGATVTVQYNGMPSTYNSISAVTSTYTSLTTSSIYYTSKIKITLSGISAGLTFEKEKEEFYFIPGITEIRFNAYKYATSNPLRTIYVRPESASYNGKSSAKLICFCREGNFTHDVTLTCKWKTLNSTTTQSFTFTVSSGSNTFSYTLQPSADLDYGDQNWSMSFADPSQALNDGYSKDIEIDKGMISLSCKTKEQLDGETTVEVNVNIPPVTDIDLLFTNERGSESYETFNARNYTQQYYLPFDGTISMSTTASSDAFYDYDY